MFLQRQPKRPRAGFDGAAAFIERKKHGVFAAFRSRDRIGQSQRRLSDTGSADEERVGASLQAAAEKLIEFGIAAPSHLPQERPVMLSRNQARENTQATGRD